MGSVQFRGELPLTTIPAVRDRTLYPSFSSSHPLTVCSPLLFNEGEAEGGEEKEKQRKIERENLHARCVQAHLLQSSNSSCSLGINRHIFLSTLFCYDLIFCQMMQWHQNQQWIIVGIFNHQLNIMAASMFFFKKYICCKKQEKSQNESSLASHAELQRFMFNKNQSNNCNQATVARETESHAMAT